MTDPLTLLESVDLLGRYRYIELALGAVLEQGGRQGEPPDVAICASVLARTHVWRARLFEELLPISVGLPSAEECTRAPNEVSAEIFASFEELDRQRLLVVLRDLWYPAMIASYGEHVARTSAAFDGPIVLSLVRAIRDLQFANEQLNEVALPLSFVSDTSFERLEMLLVKSAGPFGHPRSNDHSSAA